MAFHLDWGIFKRHPYATAGGAIALFVLIYLVVSSEGQSSQGASDTSSLAYDEQQQQLSAQESIAGLQAQASEYATQTQGSIQSQAIAASQDVTNNQTNASLQAYLQNSNNELTAVQSQNQTQVSLAQVQANEQDTVVNSLAQIVGDQYATQQNQENDIASVLENQTNVAGSVATDQINTQGALSSQALKIVGSGQLNKGGQGGQLQVAGLGAALGEPTVGVAGEAAGANVAASNNALTSNIVGSVIGAGSSILQGLVG